MIRKLLLACAALLVASAAYAQVPNIPNQGGVPTGNGYPLNSNPVVVSNTGADTASLTAVLPATPGKTNFICGFSISGLGATAIGNVVATIGSLGSPNTAAALSFQYSMPVGATVPAVPVIVFFPPPCIPGIGSNNPITLTVPGAAGNTTTSLNIWGYQMTTP